MAENIGGYLRELRTARGLTTTELAARAGLRRATISEWQAGRRQPRLLELDAALNALNVTDAQKRKARELLQTPANLLRLREEMETRQPELTEVAGYAAHGGDLLRAMRRRKGWTQAQLARAINVTQAALNRWERGERWPETAALHTLCYLLGATEAELAALTVGRFSLAANQPSLTAREIHAGIAHIQNQSKIPSEYALAELGFLNLSAHAWKVAQRENNTEPLAEVHACYANYLYMERRFAECAAEATRAIEIYQYSGKRAPKAKLAASRLAQAIARRGDRRSLHEAAELLEAWQPDTSDVLASAWMQSDIGLFLAGSGKAEAGIARGKAAVAQTAHLANDANVSAENWYRRNDLARILLRVGLAGEARDAAYWNQPHPSYALTLAEAHYQSGETDEARRQVQGVLTTLETCAFGISAQEARYYRPEAETLAERLSAATADS